MLDTVATGDILPVLSERNANQREGEEMTEMNADEVREIDAEEFAKLFGTPPARPRRGQFMDDASYRAYMVIQRHMEHLMQMVAFRNDGENVTLDRELSENGAEELVAEVGRERAEAIVAHYGLLMPVVA